MVDRFQVNEDGSAVEIESPEYHRRSATGFSLNGPDASEDDVVEVISGELQVTHGNMDGRYISIATTSGDQLTLSVGSDNVTEEEFVAIRTMIEEAVAPIRDSVALTPAQTSELAARYCAIERAVYDAIDR